METEALERRKKVIYQFICDKNYIPMKVKEIAILLSISKEQRNELKEVLDVLVKEGKIEVTSKGKYLKAQKAYAMGTFISHAKGFGFVETGEGEDIFIPTGQVGGALHKDVVQVRLEQGAAGKRKEGSIVKIISHGITKVVGTYQNCNTFGFVVPDDLKIAKDIFVQKEHSMQAVNGHKVIVEIINYGKEGKKPEGKVVEILGHINEPGTDIMALIRTYELPVEFPEKVQKQAYRAAKDVTPADMAGRMDLRDWQMVTIDGEDAKDLDDAVSLTKEDGIYCLGVHIADVTNYVQEHSALDAEAFERGTSVYLADRVIPMLPPVLSNGICSLNQEENRLALSCIMKIDENGKVIDHTIAETVICVNRRMTYTAVKQILEGKNEIIRDEYREFVPMFEQMEKLAALLRERRKARGSIDFDFPETKIKLDKKGHPIEIKPYERNVATKIIEDFMLIANETVAEDFFWQQIPFVYRIHDNPDEEKIRRLAAFINNFGYSIHIGQEEVHPKEIQKLLTKLEGSPEEALIGRLTLRSMKQAKYSVENIGHFGLAAPYYCHFTSPIRRYPDLQIHRIIKECLRGKMNQNRITHYEGILPEAASHSSETERRAEEAERETNKLKKAEYMLGHIGETFEGVISGITAWGMYVELENTIEGLVHVTTLTDDYYEYAENTYELVGKAKNRHYKLGQKVLITVVSADLLQRTIDFALAEETGAGSE